jgi:serine protease SohB
MTLKNLIGRSCEKLAAFPVIGPFFEARPKISVIRLSGVIADAAMRRQTISHAKFEKTIEDAFDVYKVAAVALVINSPGGSAAQSALIARQIRALSEEKDIPVFAFVEDVAASGGYWLACAADEIYASEVSIVGSIGVISASFGFHELIARYGVERRVHTAGRDKSFLDPFLPEKPGDLERLKNVQDDLHQSFIDWVNERRGEKLKGADKDLFEGQFWTARPALEKGVIDAIGDLRSIMRSKYGEKVKMIDFGGEKRWLPTLLGTDMAQGEALLGTLENRALWARFGL